MAEEQARGRHESRMTLRTYVPGREGQESGEPGEQLMVIRPRDPLSTPVSPLTWPSCICQKCRGGPAT